MDDRVKVVQVLPEPLDRAKRASSLHAEFQVAINELSRIRREALDELVGQGRTHAQIAEDLGMTRARIGQLLSSGPKIERAFLGSGPVTVALGGKVEANKEKPGSVIAQEDFQAYEAFQQLAQSVSLTTQYEVIQPPGMLDLNRDNLTVICGPRISPLIAQVLASDDNVKFDRDDSGWHLLDRVAKTEFRSPMDSGEPSDFAYLGRLPRLDGKGNFLYIAGIHAVGAAGVVHYLDKHLSELYKEVKTGRFSTIIQCSFDPDTRKIRSSKRVSPLYRAEAAS
ncbi:sigma-70 family RNA polymerase sigma factor [Crossiella sp. CA198]|uniref:sigma-70 family RNA polymerase sigma factor n=1 Tax=Crossiella sp. CA198 TaxID=3455607 RepID=UPI003F8D84F5